LFMELDSDGTTVLDFERASSPIFLPGTPSTTIWSIVMDSTHSLLSTITKQTTQDCSKVFLVSLMRNFKPTHKSFLTLTFLLGLTISIIALSPDWLSGEQAFQRKASLKELQGSPTSFVKCGARRLSVCNLCVRGWRNELTQKSNPLRKPLPLWNQHPTVLLNLLPDQILNPLPFRNQLLNIRLNPLQNHRRNLLPKQHLNQLRNPLPKQHLNLLPNRLPNRLLIQRPNLPLNPHQSQRPYKERTNIKYRLRLVSPVQLHQHRIVYISR
jgi:hypothetical protein